MAQGSVLVTGGTRGIGRAIVERPARPTACQVAAGYAGNEEAAKACANELGVMVVKGNVGDFEDCAARRQGGRGRARPHRGPGQQRRHHPRRHAAQDDPEQWNEVIRVNMDLDLQHEPPGHRGHARRAAGAGSSTSRSINGQKGQMGQTNYSGRQGRRDRLHQGPRPGERQARASRSTPIAPGYIDTENGRRRARSRPDGNIIAGIPVGRLGKGEEIADMRRSRSWPASGAGLRGPGATPIPAENGRPVHGRLGDWKGDLKATRRVKNTRRLDEDCRRFEDSGPTGKSPSGDFVSVNWEIAWRQQGLRGQAHLPQRLLGHDPGYEELNRR